MEGLAGGLFIKYGLSHTLVRKVSARSVKMCDWEKLSQCHIMLIFGVFFHAGVTTLYKNVQSVLCNNS